MKAKATFVALAAILIASRLSAQNTLQVSAGPPAPVSSVTPQTSGATGNATECYWVIAIYPIGQAFPGGPGCLSTAGFAAGGTVVVNWAKTPPATGYTVLRTPSSTFPAGSCSNCLLANNVAGGPVTDTGAALSGYTISNVPAAQTTIYLDNTDFSAPVTVLGSFQVKVPSIQFGDGTIQSSAGVGQPTGAAGGDLSGNYPNPLVVKVNGGAIPISAPCTGTNGSGQFISVTCGTGGGGGTFQVNGTNLSSSTVVNFQNSAPFQGMTGTFSNPSAGNIQLGFSGTLQVSQLTDTNGNPSLTTITTASAVDQLSVTNAAAANPATVTLSATGSDANINVNLVSKGSGGLQANGVAIGTVTNTGGTLTALSIVVGNGGNDSKPSNVTVDGSLNNLTIPGTLTTGGVSGNAGALGLLPGTQALTGLPANSSGFLGASSVTGQHYYNLPATGAAANQFFLFGAESSGISPVTLTTFSATNLTDSSLLVRNNAANTYSSGLQDLSAVDLRIPNHSSDPGTCGVGQIEFNTTGAQFKICNPTNTWGTVAGSGAPATITLLSKSASYSGASSDFSTATAPPNIIEFTLSASGQTYTLPSGAPALIGGNMPCVILKNVTALTAASSFYLQVLTGGSTTLDGVAFASAPGWPIGLGQSMEVCSDGSNYHTIKGIGLGDLTRGFCSIEENCVGTGASTNLNGTANKVTLEMFRLHAPSKVGHITAHVVTASAGTADGGLYDSAGNLITHCSGGFSSGSTGAINCAASTTVILPPGLYFIGACNSATGAAFSTFNQSSTNGVNNLMFDANIGIMGTATNTCSTGVLPATTGTVVQDQSSMNGYPLFLFRP